MESRQKTNDALDRIQHDLRRAMIDVGYVIGHLNEWSADDFSDLHELDKEGALRYADSIIKQLEEIKLNLDHTVAFLRRG